MTYREAAWTFLRGTKVMKAMDGSSEEALKAMDGMSHVDYLRAVLFLSHMSPEVDDTILESKTWALLGDEVWMDRLERLAVELVDTQPGT